VMDLTGQASSPAMTLAWVKQAGCFWRAAIEAPPWGIGLGVERATELLAK
jgi:hypothetical protein